ncbi:MAG: NUDIX hydrolase, partial [Desulfobacterales bacterium]|nr:NUDIX hydrolase [Desulfobacterales bacterium]
MNEKMESPRAWRLIKTEEGPDLGLFKVRYNWRENPRNGRELKTVMLDSIDWVNAVAITRDERIVVVRQYRFGIEDFTTEIPGGMVDPGEDSGQAAARELLEETGYTSRSWESLGSVQPNPAFHNNLCHHWLARDAEKTSD